MLKMYVMPNEQPTKNNIVTKSGFSLVELLISLFFIVTLVVILYSLSGTQLTRYESNVQSVASKVATKEIERLRGVPFASLPAHTDCNDPPIVNQITFTQAEQDRLANRSGTSTIVCYGSPPSLDIMQVTVNVGWDNNNGAQRDITMDTLIYRDGL